MLSTWLSDAYMDDLRNESQKRGFRANAENEQFGSLMVGLLQMIDSLVGTK